MQISINEAFPLDNETFEQAKERVLKFYKKYPFDIEKVKQLYKDYENVSLTIKAYNEIYKNNY